MARKWFLGTILALFVALIACAPKQLAVTSTPAPAPQSAQLVPTVSSAPSQSAEDVAWSRVIAAARKEGKVNVYGYTFIGDLNQTVADAFYQKYGIRADIIAGPGSVLSERIRTEERLKAPIADVAESGVTFATVLKQDGLLVPMGKELPVLREDAWIVPLSMDDVGSILRGYPSMNSPWVNSDVVKASDTPKTWTDLLDPRWSGKMIIIDPRTATSADRYVYTLVKYKIVEPDFFSKLAGQKLINPAGIGTRLPWTGLAKGEGAIMVFGGDSQGAPILAEGAHIRPIVLAGGVIGTSSAFQLVKDGPHPNAARLFIDFALSRQGYDLVTGTNKLVSFRKDVTDHSVMAGLQPFQIVANTLEDETQIAKNNREGVAAKALGIQ